MDNFLIVDVFSGELWEATIIKNILEDNNIESFLENELMGSIAPWIVTSGGINTVKVKTTSLDYEKAIELIKEYNGAN